MSVLAHVIDTRRDEIIDRWTVALRSRVSPKVLSLPELIDHMPDFLEFVIARLRGEAGPAEGVILARERGAQRLAEGFSTDQVVREYGLMYDIVIDVAHLEPGISTAEIHILAQEVIDAIAACAAEYSRRKRERLRRSDTLFQALFESTPDPYVVISPDFTIMAANDAYLRATRTNRERILGEPFFDVFPDNPADPTGARALRTSFERVLSHRRREELPVHKYDLRGDSGEFEERYWKPSNTPVMSNSGEVELILHRVIDVTGARRTEAALAGAESALAERIRVLEGILGVAGEAILVIEPGTRHVVLNQAARDLFGAALIRPMDGWSHRLGLFHVDQVTRLDDDEMPLARSLAGEVVHGLELWVHNSTVPDGRVVRATARPLRDDRGAIVGAVGTFADITDLKQAQRQLADLAVTDELTGLPNRRALRQRLDLLVAERDRGRQFAVIFADVDHFKHVNDIHGHQVGDLALIAIAHALQRGARRADFVARLGGEEFCVLSADVEPASARAVAERMRAAVAEIQRPVPVTCSFGVSHSTLSGDPDELLALADAALYQAKRAGRDRVVVHDPSDPRASL
jgi:diguanylate cyclase (GGDEF)-like protein/PAS domain S-box-containing protein